MGGSVGDVIKIMIGEVSVLLLFGVEPRPLGRKTKAKFF
jgi:hypothetical protein